MFLILSASDAFCDVSASRIVVNFVPVAFVLFRHKQSDQEFLLRQIRAGAERMNHSSRKPDRHFDNMTKLTRVAN
jgi:hypothetical protein